MLLFAVACGTCEMHVHGRSNERRMFRLVWVQNLSETSDKRFTTQTDGGEHLALATFNNFLQLLYCGILSRTYDRTTSALLITQMRRV